MGVESEDRSKTDLEQGLRDARKKMLDLRYEWDAAVVRRAELVLRHRGAIERIREAHHVVLEAEIRRIEAQSDVAGLKERNAHIMEQLDVEKQSLQQATDEANLRLEEGRQLADKMQELLHDAAPEQRTIWQDLQEGKTPEYVQMEMDAEEAKLELIHAANPNVIREFEKRAQEITRLTRKVEGVNEKLEGLTRETDDIMSKWEPCLDELVSKINDAFAYNFEQISCAGEVRVHKAEDFDAWALDIMVRFR